MFFKLIKSKKTGYKISKVNITKFAFIRKNLNLTQKQISKLSGISLDDIKKIERGTSNTKSESAYLAQLKSYAIKIGKDFDKIIQSSDLFVKNISSIFKEINKHILVKTVRFYKENELESHVFDQIKKTNKFILNNAVLEGNTEIDILFIDKDNDINAVECTEANNYMTVRKALNRLIYVRNKHNVNKLWLYTKKCLPDHFIRKIEREGIKYMII